jgi:hypothetical protein
VSWALLVSISGVARSIVRARSDPDRFYALPESQDATRVLARRSALGRRDE